MPFGKGSAGLLNADGPDQFRYAANIRSTVAAKPCLRAVKEVESMDARKPQRTDFPGKAAHKSNLTGGMQSPPYSKMCKFTSLVCQKRGNHITAASLEVLTDLGIRKANGRGLVTAKPA
jgi:hypothetical protein